jgi:hypothetical protein
VSQLYAIGGKTIFPVIDNPANEGGWLPPREEWVITRWISVEIPEDEQLRYRLLELGDTNGCKLIDKTKQEYEAQ